MLQPDRVTDSLHTYQLQEVWTIGASTLQRETAQENPS